MKSALALAALALVVASTAAAQTNPPAYRISALQPFLFYNDTGTFSGAIPKDAPLWNTIIGEGWARQSSNQTLVRVTVAGEAGSYAPRRAVKLVVRRGTQSDSGKFTWGKVVLSRSEPLAVLTRRGTTQAGFWLYETGCVPLLLTASLTGQTSPSTQTRVIPFACGE